MGKNNQQQMVDEMNQFAQSAKKKPLPQKPSYSKRIEEDDYEATESVKTRKKPRVVYTEDIEDETPPPSENKNKPHHRQPSSDPTADAAIRNIEREERTKNETKNENPPKAHKPAPKPKKDKKEKHNRNPKPVSTAPPRLPATSDTPKCISKVSNMIKKDLETKCIFDELQFNTKQRIHPETFYKKTGSAIYNSLLEFIGIERFEDGTDPESGRQIWGFNLPKVSRDTPNLGTWYFFDRVYHNKSVSYETDAGLMDKYRRIFQDDGGIDIGWLEFFREEMKKRTKFPNISNSSINLLIDDIRNTWCAEPVDEPEESVDVDEYDDNPTNVTVEQVGGAEVLQTPKSAAGYAEDIDDDDTSTPVDDSDDDGYDDGYDDDGDDDNDGDDDDGDVDNSLNIELERIEDIDQLTIIPRNQNSVTFYINLDDVPTVNNIPSLGDPRNGIWDWLMHFVPNMIFTTMEPEKYIHNDAVADTKIIVLEENDGIYTMGIYYVDEDFGNELLDDDSEDTNHRELIMRINTLVKREIGSTVLSYRDLSLKMKNLYWEEDEILAYINVSNPADSDDDYSDEPADADAAATDAFTSAIASAAEAAISGGTPVTTETTEEEPVDENDYEPDPTDEPQYPGEDDDNPVEENYSDDESSDFVFTPLSRENKYKK